MAYTALYRKFRPTTFSEIVGQEHITRTLRNQIIAGRVGHAYLFNGGRGTGKTSAAKVLARAVNCLNPKDGEPCNQCEICKAALAGSLTDIVEMDAASNNSVEDIRQIRDEVNFLPTLAKYRVYIIDEVHMLSPGAFNALLKTLEEPPEHVKFILATTEPQRLPATILSRCQRFDFKKISDENIEKRLKYVCEQSNIEISKEALGLIATLSEGAMRDALSILERCLQDGETKIEEDKVRDLVGIPKLTFVNRISKAIIDYNVEEALETTNDVINEGKDIQNLLWELVKYIKDILVYKASKKLQLYKQEEIEKIKELSENTTKERLLDIIYKLSTLENDIKWSSQKIIMFQVGIIKLCTKQEEVIHKNVEYVDNQTANKPKIEINNYNMQQGAEAERKEVNINKRPEIKNESTERKITTTSNLQTNSKFEAWPKILSNLKQSGKIMLYTNLMNAKVYPLNDMVMAIEFTNGITPFVKGIMEKPENISELEKRISMECGKTMRVKLIDSKNEKPQVTTKNDEPIQKLAQDYDLPINIIE